MRWAEREPPRTWRQLALKRLFSIVNGSTPKSDDPAYWNGDIPWVTPDDLGALKVPEIRSTQRLITQEGYRSCGTTLVPAGSLVVSTRAPIGYVAIATTGICTNQGCKSLVSNDDASGRFFYYQLLAAQPELISYGQGSTFAELAATKLGAINLFVPPRPEQDAITAFLDRETAKIDALIAKKQRLLALLEEKRTALVTRAVTKGLDPTVPMKESGVEWLGEVPAHWEVKRLKHLTSSVTSGSRGWAEYYSDDGPMFLRIGNLSRSSIELDLSDVQRVDPPHGAEGARTRVLGGDVLISITAFIGSVGVVPDGFDEAYVNQHLALARPRKSGVSPWWLAYCLSSDVGQVQCALSLYGGTKEGLGLDDVGALRVLVPPHGEQTVIVGFLDEQTALLEALKSKARDAIALLREYRTALISAAVTGQIDVSDKGSAGKPAARPSR
jgi:type I restriction enzyme, S subunit